MKLHRFLPAPALARRCLRPLLCLALGLAGMSAPRAHADEALDALVSVLKDSTDAQLDRDILTGLQEGLVGRTQVAVPKDWGLVEPRLLGSADATVRTLARSLAVKFGSTTALATLRTRLTDRTAKVAERRDALATLLGARDASLPPVLLGLLSEPALRADALRALARYPDAAIPAAVIRVYGGLSPVEKRDALTTLAARAEFARALLAAVERKAIPAADLMADVVRQLRQFNQPDLTAQVTKLWGVTRESPAEKRREIARYKALLTAKSAGKPDPTAGRATYQQTCAPCHTLFGEGGKVGPDITGANRADLDYLLHNILDPNAEIPNDYRTSNLDTKDERGITGIVTRQDGQSVTIVTATETLTIPRAEIASLRQSGLSMMPEGLLQPLKESEVRDLIAYLQSGPQAPLP